MTQREDGIDLSYLDDPEKAKDEPPRSGKVVAKGALGRDFYDTPRTGLSKSNKSLGQVESSVAKLWMQPTPQIKESRMQTVDVKCNYARDRVEVLAGGELILKFDQNGICKMPAHLMPLLRQVQRVRPGRFTVVTNVASTPAEPAVPAKPKRSVEEVLAAKKAKADSAAVEAPKESEDVASEDVVEVEVAPKKETKSKSKSKPKPVEKKTRGKLVKSTSDESK